MYIKRQAAESTTSEKQSPGRGRGRSGRWLFVHLRSGQGRGKLLWKADVQDLRNTMKLLTVTFRALLWSPFCWAFLQHRALLLNPSHLQSPLLTWAVFASPKPVFQTSKAEQGLTWFVLNGQEHQAPRALWGHAVTTKYLIPSLTTFKPI